jgi:hypothetical protein
MTTSRHRRGGGASWSRPFFCFVARTHVLFPSFVDYSDEFLEGGGEELHGKSSSLLLLVLYTLDCVFWTFYGTSASFAKGDQGTLWLLLMLWEFFCFSFDTIFLAQRLF